VKFVDAPPPGVQGRPIKYANEASELKARRGEWALLSEKASSSTASMIKNGVLASFRPPGSFEAVCRNQRLGYGEIYARYVGEEDA
jgi:hypothetical protein